MKISFLIVFTFMFSLLSCTSQKQVTAPVQTVEVVSMNMEESGEKMFQKRCAECHDLSAPNAYTSQQCTNTISNFTETFKIHITGIS